MDKERKSLWLPDIRTVLDITESHGQKFYKVSDYPRLLLRHELLKMRSS